MRISKQYVAVRPAYGRTYKSAAEVTELVLSGKHDFQLIHTNQYTSIRDWPNESTVFEVRWGVNLEKVTMVDLSRASDEVKATVEPVGEMIVEADSEPEGAETDKASVTEVAPGVLEIKSPELADMGISHVTMRDAEPKAGLVIEFTPEEQAWIKLMDNAAEFGKSPTDHEYVESSITLTNQAYPLCNVCGSPRFASQHESDPEVIEGAEAWKKASANDARLIEFALRMYGTESDNEEQAMFQLLFAALSRYQAIVCPNPSLNLPIGYVSVAERRALESTLQALRENYLGE